MRILLVSHLFPPAHSAGTEVYTAELGTRLAARGHAVAVFTTDKHVGRRDLSVVEREHRGLRVIELTNNLFLDSFEETWERPGVAKRFAAVLDELAPDVVHFHHLLYLSAGCLEEARRRGAAVLLTLHDFWLECARLGQLVHADGSLCHRVDFERCGTCLPSFAWRQSEAARRTGETLARVRSWTGVDLAPLARGAARSVRARRGRPAWTPPAGEEARRFAELARTRDRELRRRVVASVDRFLSPSRFLRERLVAWGIPPERIEQVATGIDREAFAPRPRGRRASLRVRFLGSLVPVKGAHVLLDAWGRLAPDVRARGELTLHGPGEHSPPEYVAALRARAAEVGARVEGPLPRAGVPALFADTDLLVVPSQWFENRPLVVLEALCARVPLVVTDLGGMAELVEEGVAGWRFPPGDAAALAERLGALLADPASLDALSFEVDELLPSWDDFTGAMLARYAELSGEEAAP